MAFTEALPILQQVDPPATLTSNADCQCQHHDLNHLQPGFCDRKAAYRLEVQDPELGPAPLIMLLCPQCLEWHRVSFTLANPLMQIKVEEL